MSAGIDAVGDDPPLAVDVVDEGVDRPHPLLEPGRQVRPIRAAVKMRGMMSNGMIRSAASSSP